MSSTSFEYGLGERIKDGSFDALFSDDLRSLISSSEASALRRLHMLKDKNNIDLAAKDWAKELVSGILSEFGEIDSEIKFFGLDRNAPKIRTAYFMLEDEFHSKAYVHFCDILKIDPENISDSSEIVLHSENSVLSSMGFYYENQEQPYAISFVVAELNT